MNDLISIIGIGIGATALTDLWGLARRPLLGVPPPDYGLVGRWFAHMMHGRFRHEAIARASAMRGEGLLGWSAHYLIGIVYATLLVLWQGPVWLRQPTLAPALVIGIATAAAPFLLMQPGMGAGIAASRMPRPWHARIQTLLMHTVFGLGLYASAAGICLLSAA